MATSNAANTLRQVPDDVYKHVIRRKKSFLVETLGYNLMNLLDKLGEHDVITDDIVIRDIKETATNKTSSDGVRRLLDEVITKSENNYRTFLEVLELDDIGMDYVSKTLCEEEEKINTEGIIMNMTELTLTDTESAEQHFDVCILFEDADTGLACEIKDYLVELDSEVRVLLFDNPAVFGTASKTEKLEKIYRNSSLQLYIVPKYGSEDKYVTWVNDSLIMQCVDNGKFNLCKVLQDKRKLNSPKLANLQDVKWYDHDREHFKVKMKNWTDDLK